MEPLAPTTGISGAPLPKGGSFLNHDPTRSASVPYQVTTYPFPSRATPICPQAAVTADTGGLSQSGHQCPAFAERALRNIDSGSASLRLDVGLPDHLGPLLGFVGDELTEVAGRASKRRAIQISELCLDLGISERRVDLLVELFDNLNGRVSRRADTPPSTRLVAWHELAYSRDIGQPLPTRRGRHRQRSQLAGLDVRDRLNRGGEHDLHLPTEQIGPRGPAAAIRYVHEVDPGHHLEQLAGHMGRGADTARRHVDLARIGLGVSDEFGDCLSWHRWIDHYDKGHDNNAGDRCNVADEIEVELVIERRVGRACVGPDHEQRVAVRRRAHDRLGADIATRARPVLDHEWLAKPLRQPLTHQTGDDVGRSAWGEWGDDAHRPRRISLRPRDARQSRQRGGARGQMQEFAAGKFHNTPLEMPVKGRFTPS